MQKVATTKLIERVLLVNNDTEIFNILSESLAQKGVAINWVNNIKDAIEKASDFIPDLVITDINSQINGFEVIKQFKTSSKSSNTNFIILSELSEEPEGIDQNFLKALGIKQFLVKSKYSPKDLANEISTALT